MKLSPFHLCFLFVSAALACTTASAQSEPQVELSTCDLYVAAGIKQSSSDFSVMYSFGTGADGEPTKITNMTVDRPVVKGIEDCLSHWRIRGTDRTKNFIVRFSWKHGRGWVSMVVIGPGINVKLSLKPEVLTKNLKPL